MNCTSNIKVSFTVALVQSRSYTRLLIGKRTVAMQVRRFFFSLTSILLAVFAGLLAGACESRVDTSSQGLARNASSSEASFDS